jgi:2'-5' RNA ligase
MKLLDIITEDHKHDFGCVMLHFKFPEMNKIQDMIDPKDIYEDSSDSSFGLETESHVTLLYGLHKGVSEKDVTNALSGITFNTCKLYNPSIFENDKYDVLKFDVGYTTRGESFLSKANKALKAFPYTSDFPDYHPHMTVAYIKPGKGKKYVDILKKNVDDITMTPDYAKYSKTDGAEVKFKISLQK